MKIIVCLDDRGGMMFNGRRLSRDRILIEDVLKTVNGAKLFIDPYSRLLFDGVDASVTENADMLDIASEGDYCFVENKHIKDFLDKIEEITLYRWNRRYPFDFELDIVPEKEGFSLFSSEEFKGYSHDVITKEIFRR